MPWPEPIPRLLREQIFRCELMLNQFGNAGFDDHSLATQSRFSLSYILCCRSAGSFCTTCFPTSK